ncbi:uncharacterized protein LOC62_01G001642 [Vanrija pseudolonga]|uniref:Wax synthase domain-containing protein n=1 Tax=Vanrija pseudolonga TaxID=143232 RepID=A0AAF1BJ93_9TREE|nr:hypothetical protein LOC62_01G001642 [Vanrija pseudolonga]
MPPPDPDPAPDLIIVVLFASLAPLVLQSYLAFSPNSRTTPNRVARCVLGVLGGVVFTSAFRWWSSQNLRRNMLTAAMSTQYPHMALKHVQLALLPSLSDSYPRARAFSALDTVINLRWRNIRIAGAPATGYLKPRTAKSHTPPKAARSRIAAVAHHARIAATQFVIMDTIQALFLALAPGTIGSPFPTPRGRIDDLLGTQLYLLPAVLPPVALPHVVLQAAIAAAIGAGTSLVLSWPYHALATVSIATGIYEPDAFDPDLFSNPFASTSLLDFWGRRWHQNFRRDFTLLSTGTVRLLRLPQRAALPLVFVFSAAYHAAFQPAAIGPRALLSVAAFFTLSGVSAGLEAAFRAITGRKVRGWPGRVWAVGFFLAAGYMMRDGWIDAGYVTVPFTTGAGRGIARYTLQHVLVPGATA